MVCFNFQPFFQIIFEFSKEIQTGLLFNFVNADGKYLQWLIGRTVRNDEADHFYWRSQVINDFVKRLGNGDFARWQIFGFRRRRKYCSGNNINLFFLESDRLYQLFQSFPNASVESRKLRRHITHQFPVQIAQTSLKYSTTCVRMKYWC